MNNLCGVVVFLLVLANSASHSKFQRPVSVHDSGQNYVAIDENIWNHARGDLGDIRLFSGDTEIPYALVVERGSFDRERKELPVLQPSTVKGKTQFLLDMSGLAEYDHVQLKLANRNFVAHVLVEGQDDPHGQLWAALGDNILYDLSSEKLGSNAILRLPRTTHKYLRVTIDGPVSPKDVLGAMSEMAEERPAVWRDLSNSPVRAQLGHDTVFTFATSNKIPLERVLFALESSQPNFRREVEVHDDKDSWIGSGEIERIHTVRAGQKIDSETDSVSFSEIGHPAIKVVVKNGDDRPLSFVGARSQQLERRVYFDAAAGSELILYYGDEKLSPPVYDYAKLFQQNKTTAAAQLGPETSNQAYTARPDERPWSERHPEVLWAAIIVAVLGLGVLALRSMRSLAA
jgi:hypothetical protein